MSKVSLLTTMAKEQGKIGYSGADALLASIEAWGGKAMDEFRTAGVEARQGTLWQN